MATEIFEMSPNWSIAQKKKSKEGKVNVNKQESLATLAMMAAMADRTLTLEERSVLERIMNGLSEESRSGIYQKVFGAAGSIEEELSELDTEALRTKGYYLVKAICESDGIISKKERQFLLRLRTAIAFSSVLEASEKRNQEVL